MTLNNKPFLADITAWTCTCVLAFVVLPGYMIALSPQDWSTIDLPWFWRSTLIVTLAVFGLGVLAYGLLMIFRLQIFAQTICWGMLFWVATAGFVIPIIQSVDMIAPSNTPISPIGFMITLMISTVLTLIALSPLRRFAVIYLIIQLGVAVGPLMPSIFEVLTKERPQNAQQFLTLSPKRNILVVSLDDISRVLALENLDKNSVLRDQFKDFTFFENLTGNAPATQLSLAHEFFGSRDFKSVGKDMDALMAGLNLDLLPMNNSQINSATYGSYNVFNTRPSRRVEIGGLSENISLSNRVSGIAKLHQYLAVRLGTRFLPIFLTALEYRGYGLSALLGAFYDLDCTDCSDLDRQLENHTGPIWDKAPISSLGDFDGLVKKVKVGDTIFAIRYMHFLFPHFPVDFDAVCDYRSDSAVWHAANQNQQAAFDETTCALHKFVALIDRLKEMDIYDNSLIVLKSDHGKISKYFDAYPDNAGFNGSKNFGLDRYRPMLMVKDFNVSEQSLTISQRAVAISDLAPSLCMRILDTKACDTFPGVDLLSTPVDQENSFWVYLPRDPQSTHRFKTLEGVIIQRGNDLVDLVDKP